MITFGLPTNLRRTEVVASVSVCEDRAVGDSRRDWTGWEDSGRKGQWGLNGSYFPESYDSPKLRIPLCIQM